VTSITVMEACSALRHHNGLGRHAARGGDTNRDDTVPTFLILTRQWPVTNFNRRLQSVDRRHDRILSAVMRHETYARLHHQLSTDVRGQRFTPLPGGCRGRQWVLERATAHH
jgi:hypothetical protein